MDQRTANRIADEMGWGIDVSVSKTNVNGVVVIDASSHGGFVMDSSLRFADGFKDAVKYGSQVRSGHIVFEEDCAYSAIVHLAGVYALDHHLSKEDQLRYAKDCFDRNLNPESESVKYRNEMDRRKAEGDPDIVVSALSVEDGRVKVCTAAQECFIVSDYDKCRDTQGTPFLSGCTNVERIRGWSDHRPYVTPDVQFSEDLSAFVSDVSKMETLDETRAIEKELFQNGDFDEDTWKRNRSSEIAKLVNRARDLTRGRSEEDLARTGMDVVKAVQDIGHSFEDPDGLPPQTWYLRACDKIEDIIPDAINADQEIKADVETPEMGA